MRTALRARKNLQNLHKGWQLFHLFGCHFAVPEHLNADLLHSRADFRAHPAILKATTRAALLELIDRRGSTPLPVEEGTCEGYDLVRAGGAVHALPHGCGPVDLDLEADRQSAGVITAGSVEEIRERLAMLRDAEPVEFAGWLPIYKLMGNCGKHPQFAHTLSPPKGYRFTRSIPPEDSTSELEDRPWFSRCVLGILKGFEAVRDRYRRMVRTAGMVIWPLIAFLLHGPNVSLRARFRLLGDIFRMGAMLRREGGGWFYILRFLQSRSFHSQILLAERRKLVFLTSAPFTYNQSPWVIEVEDPTTLFFPFIHNGNTHKLNIADSPYFPIVRALLESDSCRVILTHMESTARMIPNLFKSDIIAKKVRYYPLGVRVPKRWQRHTERNPEHINLLYINSWSQTPANFQVRGGLDVLEAFSILRERYPNLRLTMRTSLIPLDEHYHRIIESGWVRIINRLITAEEMESLHTESHIYLLPAARIHIVSLLQAMASGLAVVASDGWGFDEYLTHERNGLMVKGRYGKTSWADEKAGILREDYEHSRSPDPMVVQGIVESVSRLVEDYELRRRLGRTARQDVETTYNLDNWNRGLQQAFAAALDGSTLTRK